MKTNFYNVGQLRKALEGLPDDKFIGCQVVGQDGSAWNLWGSFTDLGEGQISVITFEHAEIKTLKGFDDPQGQLKKVVDDLEKVCNTLETMVKNS